MKDVSMRVLKKRRSSIISLLAALLLVVAVAPAFSENRQDDTPTVQSANVDSLSASDALQALEVKGRAPKTGYSRSQFSSGWASYEGCDVRNIMLQRSLEQIELDEDECTVLVGVLEDPYTGNEVIFVRGRGTSDDVQIDHVVALSDAWQKGAQEISQEERMLFANDSLNLLAVEGSANQQKGDADAASWLPPNKEFRCPYVARQIAVKQKYRLWVTPAEKSAMERVLNGCGEQVLPIEE